MRDREVKEEKQIEVKRDRERQREKEREGEREAERSPEIRFKKLFLLGVPFVDLKGEHGLRAKICSHRMTMLRTACCWTSILF
jgi:hypothetical protein